MEKKSLFTRREILRSGITVVGTFVLTAIVSAVWTFFSTGTMRQVGFLILAVTAVIIISVLVAHMLKNRPEVVFSDATDTPEAQARDTIRREYINERVKLASVVDTDGVIRNKKFIECELYGPALVCPVGENIEFVDPHYHGRDETSLLIDLPEGSRIPDGAIGLDNVKLVSCHLHKITMCGHKENMNRIRSILGLTNT